MLGIEEQSYIKMKDNINNTISSIDKPNHTTVCEIIPFLSTDRSFVYKDSKGKVELMDLVKVRFGSQIIFGICIKVHCIPNKDLDEFSKNNFNIESDKIRDIIDICIKSALQKKYWEFLRAFSNYNILPIGQTLELGIPSALYSKKNQLELSFFSLHKNYEANLETLSKLKRKKVVDLLDYFKKNNNLLSGAFILEKKIVTKQLFSNLIEDRIIEENSDHVSKNTHKEENEEDISLSEEKKLNIEQLSCVQAIELHLKQEFSPIFLHGVTGSGKTEVYIQSIAKLLNKDSNAQILILLPEITMVSLMLSRFQRRFHFKIHTWHSGLKSSDKQRTIRNIFTGKTKILLGVRSSILLPFKNLKLVIVDEEHDSSYKQEDTPTYNARDMSVMRAKIEQMPVLLCSATPSIETYYNAKIGKYKLLEMFGRFSKVKMPYIKIQNTNKQKLISKIITKESAEEIEKAVQENEQVMLFINRRGYSRMIECKECNKLYDCPNCDNNLVYHLKSNILICHYCNHRIVKPESCLYCSKDLVPKYVGAIGIEKVEEELKALIPSLKIGVMSSDTMAKEEEASAFMSSIENNEINLILSTQIGSKGYNFKRLNLVIAIGIDIDHITGDMKIFEKTYQLLTQVSGRAGRFAKQGKVIIQTKNPNNAVLQSILSEDPKDFYEKELERRKDGNLPPYSRQACITISSEQQEQAREYTMELYRNIAKAILEDDSFKHIKILGPIPSNIHRLKRQYRYNILLRHQSGNILNRIIYKNIQVIRPKTKKVFVKIDIDPINII